MNNCAIPFQPAFRTNGFRVFTRTLNVNCRQVVLRDILTQTTMPIIILSVISQAFNVKMHVFITMVSMAMLVNSPPNVALLSIGRTKMESLAPSHHAHSLETTWDRTRG